MHHCQCVEKQTSMGTSMTPAETKSNQIQRKQESCYLCTLTLYTKVMYYGEQEKVSEVVLPMLIIITLFILY